MKRIIMLLVVLCIVIPMTKVDSQEGAREKRPMDMERIKQIAEKQGITPQEVIERMRNKARRDRGDRGGPGMGEQPPAPAGGQSVAIATTDKYLFVVKGNYVYQFDINTMKLLNKATLEEEQDQKRDKQAEMQKKIEYAKKKIEQLRKEGKVEEAEKLENALKRYLDAMKRGGKRPEGRKQWKKPKREGDPAKEGEKDANKEGEVLF